MKPLPEVNFARFTGNTQQISFLLINKDKIQIFDCIFVQLSIIHFENNVCPQVGTVFFVESLVAFLPEANTRCAGTVDSHPQKSGVGVNSVRCIHSTIIAFVLIEGDSTWLQNQCFTYGGIILVLSGFSQSRLLSGNKFVITTKKKGYYGT